MENAVLEHARKFLSRVIPAIPDGETAYLNIHWGSPAINDDGTPRLRENGEPAKRWDGRACSTVDEAVKTVAWVNGQGGKDIYVCMSLQAKYEPKRSKKGHDYRKAMRLADDAVLLKSLFIDMDVKEGAYPSTTAALAALKGFLNAASMPNPTAVVLSGTGGLHAHWVSDTPMARTKWQGLANSLAAAVKQHGVICDTQCTVDAARILRVPDTKNYKHEEPKEVTLLALSDDDIPLSVLEEVLEPYKQFAPPPPAQKIAANDELGAGMTSAAKPIKLEEVTEVCPFIKTTVETGGVHNPNPVWFLTGVLATHLEDGRDAFHEMSNLHHTYTPAETDRTFDRLMLTKSRRDVGWPGCEKFASYGCAECQNCPLRVHNKSPLNFILRTQPAASPDLSLPSQYASTPDGTIAMRAINDDGTPLLIPLCHYPILHGWLSNNPWTLYFISEDERKRKTTVEVPTEVIFSKDGFNKYLGAKGFFCSDRQYKMLKDFFVAWLQKLQSQKESVISSSQFGWSVVDGKLEGFTYAGRVWMPGNDRPAASPNPQLQYQYTPKGSIQPWADAAEVVYEQKRPALNAILAVAFAAPLVRFTGFGGLIFNGFSPESGIGKTTSMSVSQAVWGSPLGMQSLDDTANSVLGKMGQLRNLPMYWDEIKTDEQTKRFCSIVFNLTGGREKTRMNADSTLRASGTWQTMMVSASNASLIDGMSRAAGSTTAGLHRLFEFQIPKVDRNGRDMGSVQRMLGKLAENYGHAGLAYAKFLGENFKRVEEEVAAMQDRLYVETEVRQEERMWVATMAVILKGAEYANELGLVKIDLGALKDFLFDTLAGMRKEVDASPSDMTNDLSVSSVLAEFLNTTRARNTLKTNRIWVSKGKPTKGTIQVLCDTSKLGEIVVHYGEEDKLMRFSSTYFTRWMADRGYSRQTWTKKMEQEFGLKIVNGKLGGGTDMVCAMEYLIELDMNHPKLATFLE